MDWVNGVIGLIGLLIGGGGILYYHQNKRSKMIENEARLSQEWEKLYREQKAEKNAAIEEMQNEIRELQIEVEKLKKLICYDFECKKRKLNIIKEEDYVEIG